MSKKMNLEEIEQELQDQEKFKALQKEGVKFEDFSIIKGTEYLQKAKSGFSFFAIVVNADNSLTYDFNECNL